MADEPKPRPGAGGADRAAGPPLDPVLVPDTDAAELLGLALEAGRLGLWAWDIGSDRVTWTSLLSSIHGLSERENSGAFGDFERTIAPEDRGRVRAVLEDAIRRGEEAFAFEYCTAPSQGEPRRVEARGRLLADGRDGPGRIVVACMDVTALRKARERERRLAEENLRLREQAGHADRAKSDFLSVMSHELRTPLNAIMGYTEIWLLGVPAPVPEAVRVQIERVRWCAQHLLRLIEEILTFTRIESGREEPRPEPTDLTALAREVADTLRPLAEERGLDFVLALPPDAVFAETDGSKVQQILFNLLSNAVKFTDEGEIRLRLRRDQGMVLFDVKDAGIGIAPEHLEDIFEPFWQVEPSRTRSHDGTGLGLSVARRLARLLGGEVTVDSTPGGGSTFTLRLPDAVPAGGAAVSQRSG